MKNITVIHTCKCSCKFCSRAIIYKLHEKCNLKSSLPPHELQHSLWKCTWCVKMKKLIRKYCSECGKTHDNNNVNCRRINIIYKSINFT